MPRISFSSKLFVISLLFIDLLLVCFAVTGVDSLEGQVLWCCGVSDCCSVEAPTSVGLAASSLIGSIGGGHTSLILCNSAESPVFSVSII